MCLRLGKISLCLVLIAALFCSPALAAKKKAKSAPNSANQDKPYVVLALSGGGIKGYAHIGVLEVFEKEGIGIAGIVGTSMGSIVGSMYASGHNAAELAEIVKNINLAELITATGGNYFNLTDKAVRDISIIRPEIHYDKDNNPVGPLGFVAGNAVLEYLVQSLSDVPVSDFNKLPIPFAAVATDVVTGEKVVIRHGSLASAVRASMAIPGVFDPWEIDGRLLVDGGMVSNMPVETAKELFPGYPVIAINLTSELEPRESLGSWIDILSQSITILTMQNVERESKLADYVINPHVKEYPILGSTDGEEIIQQGRDEAIKDMPEIRKLLATAPRHPIVVKDRWDGRNPNITDVQIVGVPDKMAAEIRSELLADWIGKPIDMKGIVKASEGISKRDDVRSVDYDIVEDGDGAKVVLRVNRVPARVAKFSGFANTVSGTGAVRTEIGSYDLFQDGDLLNTRFYLGDNWGADFNYYWAMDVSHENFWEAGLSATRYNIDSDMGNLRWQKYAFDVSRHFTLHQRLRLSAGATFASLQHVSGEDSLNYWAPMAEATLNLTDDPDDPTSGWLFNVKASWVNEVDAMLLRAEFVGRESLGGKLGAEIVGGYSEGEMSENRLFAAYLGARDELYSLSNHPITAERFLWWRGKLRYPVMDTMFGAIVAEVFGGQGYAWDDDNEDIGHPWEVGLALCAPRRLIDGRVYAVYSDDKEWTFGLNIGVPDWDLFHLF